MFLARLAAVAVGMLLCVATVAFVAFACLGFLVSLFFEPLLPAPRLTGIVFVFQCPELLPCNIFRRWDELVAVHTHAFVGPRC